MDPKYRLAELSDDALLLNLKRCVGGENEITALMLAHLAEVDARGAYRQWACASLVSYCVYELRLSEDEAQRRCRAARTARQFPILFEMLADASIHLTGILLLGRHLTQENYTELLARARYRTKRDRKAGGPGRTAVGCAQRDRAARACIGRTPASSPEHV